MISNKVNKHVDDSICVECSQYWDDECRAFYMPHSDEERKSQKSGKMSCRKVRSRE